jgi:hypothetical protein
MVGRFGGATAAAALAAVLAHPARQGEPIALTVNLAGRGHRAHAPAGPCALDSCSLATLCDVFFPRIFVKRASWVAVTLAAIGTHHLLAHARAHQFRNGYDPKRSCRT